VAVYVDDFRVPWRGRRWCHLTADSEEELHVFAGRLGIPQRGFHHDPARPWKAHYDIPEAVREEALRLGARPITRREAARMQRERRTASRAG
jgi:Protein of unknown function (DUF4031)